MRARILSSAILAVSVVGTWVRAARAASDVTLQPPPAAVPAASGTATYAASSDVPEQPAHEALSVQKIAGWRGMLFYPSAPPPGTFRFALGANYDALDPEVMYGMTIRAPQLTLDAVDWIGGGWSLKAHLNTMLAINELLVGAGYTWQGGPLSVELAANVGVYLGTLGGVGGAGDSSEGRAGFKALFVSPEYRPDLTIGWDFGKLAVSLRGSLIFMGPVRARVGDVWGGFDAAHPFAGHSEMLYVENTTRGRSVWYFGAGAMTTRAYYALWILFPDSPALYTYPRIVVGYEY